MDGKESFPLGLTVCVNNTRLESVLAVPILESIVPEKDTGSNAWVHSGRFWPGLTVCVNNTRHIAHALVFNP